MGTETLETLKGREFVLSNRMTVEDETGVWHFKRVPDAAGNLHLVLDCFHPIEGKVVYGN